MTPLTAASEPSPPSAEGMLSRCHAGDLSAVAELRSQCHESLSAILRARGASATEAGDVLADLWSDCFPHGDRPSILDKFSGKTTIQRWLATVATNRWLDFKRHQGRWLATAADPAQPLDLDVVSREAADLPQDESALVQLLEQSLRVAFARCSSQAIVLLRLVYLHEVSQREVGRMLGWSESKLSRFLSEAMSQIERDTLAEIRRRDPWLELNWQDFLELCETQQIGFL